MKDNSGKNIILILSDDQGYWSLGCYGNKEIISPNIDSLADNGVLFKDFYCVSPVCSPARASILTGKIPSAHGVHDWLEDGTDERKTVEYMSDLSSYVNILSDNGYNCGLSGKWHLGNSGNPQMGFKHWFAHQSGGGPYYGAPMYRDGKLYHEEKYITDVITDDAINFIEDNINNKFYLHIGYTAPHAPWLNNHPEEYTDLYKDCEFKSVPDLNYENYNRDSVYLTKEVLKDVRANLIGYYSAITAMDFNVGRIIDKLKENNLLEDTIIIFSSDNGFSCGHNGFWGKGNATFPLNLYEESVKVPFIISYGGMAKNKVIDQPASAYDIRQTILELANIEDEKIDKLPGKSIIPIINGCKNNDPIVVFDEYGPNRMIRYNDYKLIKSYPYGENKLYDLKKDPGEINNLYKKHEYKNIKDIMTILLEEWFQKNSDYWKSGSTLNVYGSGQIGKLEKNKNNEDNFLLDDYIKETEYYKKIKDVD